MTTNEYVIANGTVAASNFDGSETLGTSISGSVGDWVMFKFTNDDLGAIPLGTNELPTPNLWYRIQGIGGTIIMDRNLPDLTSESTDVEYFVYPGGEVYDAFGLSALTAYWDSGTLAFNSSCNIVLWHIY